MDLMKKMRVYHRYLGFFLAGIMGVYALSGVVLIFRETNFLKSENHYEKQLPKNTKIEDLGKRLGMKRLDIQKTENGVVYFREGTFNTETSIAHYSKKELPFVIDKFISLHKATTDKPLFVLNIFFGVSLLFFVISSFWMFAPETAIFKKGMYFTLGGIVLTLVLVFV